jgi:hypothetical protein
VFLYLLCPPYTLPTSTLPPLISVCHLHRLTVTRIDQFTRPFVSTEPNFMSASSLTPLADTNPENDIYESSQHDSSSTSWYSVPSSTPSPTPSEFFESLLTSLTPPAPSAPLPQQPLAIQNRPSATRESPPHGYRCDLSDGHWLATRIYDVSPQFRSSHSRQRSPPNRRYERDSESRSSSQERTAPIARKSGVSGP